MADVLLLVAAVVVAVPVALVLSVLIVKEVTASDEGGSYQGDPDSHSVFAYVLDA